MDQVIGVEADGLSPTAERCGGSCITDRCSSPTRFTFSTWPRRPAHAGADADPAVRNVIGIIPTANKELATRAVLLRKYGQEVHPGHGRKKIHNRGRSRRESTKNLSIERDALLRSRRPRRQDDDWAEEAVRVPQGLPRQNRAHHGRLRRLSFESWPRRPDGSISYHGAMQAVDAGKTNPRRRRLPGHLEI